jgi:chromosome segregation ATPase
MFQRSCHKIEDVIQELQHSLSSEMAVNRQHEKTIDYLESDNEIKSLHREIERLENVSDEEITDLTTKISNLNKELYHAKKNIRDREKHIAEIEKRIEEYDKTISFLKQRIKNITSRGNSPDLYNMANVDPFINIATGLRRLKNHFLGIVTLNKPANIIQSINGTLNTIRANYQRIEHDLEDVTAQRDIRDDQITQLQIDINWYRQRDTVYQNEINRLTQEYDDLQQSYDA